MPRVFWAHSQESHIHNLSFLPQKNLTPKCVCMTLFPVSRAHISIHCRKRVHFSERAAFCPMCQPSLSSTLISTGRGAGTPLTLSIFHAQQTGKFMSPWNLQRLLPLCLMLSPCHLIFVNICICLLKTATACFLQYQFISPDEPTRSAAGTNKVLWHCGDSCSC